jgi:hypothetical protein
LTFIFLEHIIISAILFFFQNIGDQNMESEVLEQHQSLVTALHEAGFNISGAEKDAKKRKLVITISRDDDDTASPETKIFTSRKKK